MVAATSVQRLSRYANALLVSGMLGMVTRAAVMAALLVGYGKAASWAA
jgi:hypothetical protein